MHGSATVNIRIFELFVDNHAFFSCNDQCEEVGGRHH